MDFQGGFILLVSGIKSIDSESKLREYIIVYFTFRIQIQSSSSLKPKSMELFSSFNKLSSMFNALMFCKLHSCIACLVPGAFCQDPDPE